MSARKVVLYLQILLYIYEVYSGKLRITVFNNCPGVKGLPITFEDVKIHVSDNGDFSMDYNIRARVDGPANLKMAWNIQRCPTREALDSCTQLVNIKTKRGCQLMGAKNEACGLMQCQDPPFECPFSKGLHIGKNCTIDLSLFKFFPLGQSYWKIRSEMWDLKDKKMYLCEYVEGQTS